jgi:hypothetical protein
MCAKRSGCPALAELGRRRYGPLARDLQDPLSPRNLSARSLTWRITPRKRVFHKVFGSSHNASGFLARCRLQGSNECRRAIWRFAVNREPSSATSPFHGTFRLLRADRPHFSGLAVLRQSGARSREAITNAECAHGACCKIVWCYDYCAFSASTALMAAARAAGK